MPPHRLDRVEEWSVERILYECEKYNGWGYLNRRPSPYLWSWTSIYRGGKYVADGVYDPDAWDQQAGCAAVFKALAGMEPGVAARLAHREAAPPRDVAAETTEQARTMRNAGSALAGTGAVAHGTAQLGTGTQPPDKSALISPLATYGVIGAGLALVIVAAVLIAHRRKLLLAKWS